MMGLNQFVCGGLLSPLSLFPRRLEFVAEPFATYLCSARTRLAKCAGSCGRRSGRPRSVNKSPRSRGRFHEPCASVIVFIQMRAFAARRGHLAAALVGVERVDVGERSTMLRCRPSFYTPPEPPSCNFMSEAVESWHILEPSVVVDHPRRRSFAFLCSGARRNCHDLPRTNRRGSPL